MSYTLKLYILYLVAVVCAAGISFVSVKQIISIARRRKIYDVPDKIRKIHGAEIPSLGGIGIFAGYLPVAAFFMLRSHFFMPAILVSSLILFFTGIYDDLRNMRPAGKLAMQLAASAIAVYFGSVRIVSCYGLFGIGDIPFWPGVCLTTVFCTFFINVFNFIDGIDGLAGVMAVFYLAVLGLLFSAIGHHAIAGISFSLCGATAGMLLYNVAPAKIYMGDTGSMFLGFTVFCFALMFVNWYSAGFTSGGTLFAGPVHAVVFAIALLFMPVYDGIRVFVLRLSKGISPLKADRSHLHYYLLDAGLTHTQAVVTIVGTNIIIVALALLAQNMSPYTTLGTIAALVSALALTVYKLRQKKLSQTKP